MLALKIILCILAAFVLFISRVIDNEKLSIVLKVVGLILVIAFSKILIKTNWNGFAILKIVALIFICVCIAFCEDIEVFEELASIFIGILFVSYFIYGIAYIINIKNCKTPDISIEKVELVNAKDNLSVKGSFSILGGEVHGEFVYAYYTKNEKGNFVLNTIPAENTEISYLNEGEQPYLEITTKTYY